MIKVPQLIAILLLAFLNVVAQSPNTASSHVQAGLAAQRAGQCEQALREYALAIQLDPQNFGAQFNSGSCYAALERWQEAATALKAALVLKPNEAIVLVTLGQVYARLDRTSEAIDLFKQALRRRMRLREKGKTSSRP